MQHINLETLPEYLRAELYESKQTARMAVRALTLALEFVDEDKLPGQLVDSLRRTRDEVTRRLGDHG